MNQPGLRVTSLNILVLRSFHSPTSTGSLIYASGDSIYYGIEPGTKHGKGPIPTGIYSVKVRTRGEFHKKYSLRFPEFHKGMLEITNVPGFTAVLIHMGNTYLDTAACLLVGTGFEKGVIFESEKAYRSLYTSVIGAALSGNLTITYRNMEE
jgi:hypothetical protein